MPPRRTVKASTRTSSRSDYAEPISADAVRRMIRARASARASALSNTPSLRQRAESVDQKQLAVAPADQEGNVVVAFRLAGHDDGRETPVAVPLGLATPCAIGRGHQRSERLQIVLRQTVRCAWKPDHLCGRWVRRPFLVGTGEMARKCDDKGGHDAAAFGREACRGTYALTTDAALIWVTRTVCRMLSASVCRGQTPGP